MNSIQSQPLCWPVGHPRTHIRKVSRFGMSLAEARDDLLEQIRKLGGINVIISSNAKLINDGLPYSKQASVADSGVAVYFHYKGEQKVLACDKWEEISENIRAIGLTIQAIRSLDRWGASQIMQRVFTGFKALPAPQEATISDPSPKKQNWEEVLKIKGIKNWSRVYEAYKQRQKETHPDNGGSHEEFVVVQAAFEEAKKAFNYKY